MYATIRSRLTKIASSALFAICRPKLSETFLAPNDVASTAVASPSWSSFCSAIVSDSVRIWKFVYRPSVDSPRPWMTAFACPIEAASAAHLLEATWAAACGT